jgi:hypothetical protein
MTLRLEPKTNKGLIPCASVRTSWEEGQLFPGRFEPWGGSQRGGAPQGRAPQGHRYVHCRFGGRTSLPLALLDPSGVAGDQTFVARGFVRWVMQVCPRDFRTHAVA